MLAAVSDEKTCADLAQWLLSGRGSFRGPAQRRACAVTAQRACAAVTRPNSALSSLPPFLPPPHSLPESFSPQHFRVQAQPLVTAKRETTDGTAGGCGWPAKHGRLTNKVAETWEATTAEPLDTSDPTLTILGLRPPPPTSAPKQTRDKHEAREPAWRLLHAATLLKIHQARTRVHLAHHDARGPRTARRARPQDILRAIRQRVASRLQYEHARAMHRERAGPPAAPERSARRRFHDIWVATGVASTTKGGLRLNLLSAPPPSAPVAPGGVHLRGTAVLLPAAGKRPPCSAWALEAFNVDEHGAHTERLRASGRIATTATHGAQNRACVAARHTWQVARQVAAAKALRYAEQLGRRSGPVTLTLPNATTARDLQQTGPREDRPKSSHRHLACNNSRKLERLNRNHGARIVLRVTDSPTPLCLQRDAETAARSTSLDTMLRPAGRAAHAIPIWDEARVWDPGD